MDTLTMNIERQWFAAIVAGTKRIERRKMSPFWTSRIEPLRIPFKLRLMNGMSHPIPEAILVVNRVSRHRSVGEYRLYLGRLLQVRRWDRHRQKPAR